MVSEQSILEMKEISRSMSVGINEILRELRKVQSKMSSMDDNLNSMTDNLSLLKEEVRIMKNEEMEDFEEDESYGDEDEDDKKLGVELTQEATSGNLFNNDNEDSTTIALVNRRDSKFIGKSDPIPIPDRYSGPIPNPDPYPCPIPNPDPYPDPNRSLDPYSTLNSRSDQNSDLNFEFGDASDEEIVEEEKSAFINGATEETRILEFRTPMVPFLGNCNEGIGSVTCGFSLHPNPDIDPDPPDVYLKPFHNSWPVSLFWLTSSTGKAMNEPAIEDEHFDGEDHDEKRIEVSSYQILRQAPLLLPTLVSQPWPMLRPNSTVFSSSLCSSADVSKSKTVEKMSFCGFGTQFRSIGEQESLELNFSTKLTTFGRIEWNEGRWERPAPLPPLSWPPPLPLPVPPPLAVQPLPPLTTQRGNTRSNPSSRDVHNQSLQTSSPLSFSKKLAVSARESKLQRAACVRSVGGSRGEFEFCQLYEAGLQSYGYGYRLDEEFNRIGHICKQKKLLDVLGYQSEKRHMDEVEDTCHYREKIHQVEDVLDRILGIEYSYWFSMKVEGRNEKIMLLKDSGATDKVKLPTEVIKEYGDKWETGGTLNIKEGICKGVEVYLQEIEVVEELLPIELGSANLILGVQRLQSVEIFLSKFGICAETAIGDDNGDFNYPHGCRGVSILADWIDGSRYVNASSTTSQSMAKFKKWQKGQGGGEGIKPWRRNGSTFAENCLTTVGFGIPNHGSALKRVGNLPMLLTEGLVAGRVGVETLVVESSEGNHDEVISGLANCRWILLGIYINVLGSVADPTQVTASMDLVEQPEPPPEPPPIRTAATTIINGKFLNRNFYFFPP